jgi:4,5-dihydroxyphthalate decarboxylase
MTAALVARGVLEEEYSVPAAAIRWRCGPADRDDAKPIIRVRPRGVDLCEIADGENLSDLLRDGKIDAAVAYTPPKCFLERAPHVARLFPDHVAVEQDYFARTGIFPLMHLVAMRRELANDVALCHAVCDAWAPVAIARVQEFMGNDYWPYGVAKNRAAIDAIARYSHAQGLASRALPVEELFAAGALAWNP